MDRAHRIGQTRDVHIYRLISSNSIEENMLRKAQKKQALDNMVIGGGDFTTDFLKRLNWNEWMAKENAKSGKSLDDALLAAEDEVDAVALKQSRKENMIQEIDFEVNEAQGVEVDVIEKIGHVEDFMFSTMLRRLHMDTLLQLNDFKV